MKRRELLGLLVMAPGLSRALAAFQQAGQQAPPSVKVEKLRDNLFLLHGGGGVSAVFVTPDGVTLVDTKNPGFGAPIISAVQEAVGRPVTRIINTHCHGDHVSGNVEFPSIEVIAQENTASNMRNWRPVSSFPAPNPPQPSIFEQNGNRNLPTRTFSDRLTLGSGDHRIELFYFGRGHTNGDAWVLFPSLRIVHAGDIFAWNHQLPIYDSNNGASGLSYADTLMKAHAALNGMADAIITGHSTVMTWNDLRNFADVNRGFVDSIRAAKKQGRSVEEFVKTWTPPAGITQLNFLENNVRAVYAELG